MAGSRMLDGCRALDLSDGRGALCGKLLADLGVDVIKVEPPGGEAGRRVGPFVRDVEGDDNSLPWIAHNADKRGVTLDIASPDGRRLFLDLVRRAHLVIESFDPGRMTELGLDHAALRGVNPRVVLTSITPFGQSGPYSRCRAADIVVMGMAGQLLLTGDADRRPLTIGLPQACLHAGADAAVGSLVALRHARRSGEGQHVDISMQASTAWFLGTTIPYYELAGTIGQRVGTLRSGGSSGAKQRQVWPCRDGFVFFFMIGGPQGAKTCRQLVKWMTEEGQANEFLERFVWETFDMASATQGLVDALSDPIAAFFATRTKRQVLDAAVRRGISVCPLLSMGDLLDDANLAARGFWTRLPHPLLPEGLPYPSRYVAASAADTCAAAAPPRIGQHNAEVFAELGLTGAELGRLQQAGVV